MAERDDSKPPVLHPLQIIVTIIVLCVYAWMLCVIHTWIAKYVPQFMLVPEKDAQTLLEYAWSVQAALSAIAISLLSFFTNFSQIEVYGVRLLNYITTDRPINRFKLNVWDESAVVVMIVGVSFIFVAKTMMSSAVFLFITTFVLLFDVYWRTLRYIVAEREVDDGVGQLLQSDVNSSIEMEQV